MNPTIKSRPENGLPRDTSRPYPSQQVFPWWDNPMAQSYRAATNIFLFPALAALQQARLFSANASAVRKVAAAQGDYCWEIIRSLFQIEPSRIPRERVQEPSAAPSLRESELEELRCALLEYEERKGDWSKAR